MMLPSIAEYFIKMFNWNPTVKWTNKNTHYRSHELLRWPITIGPRPSSSVKIEHSKLFLETCYLINIFKIWCESSLGLGKLISLISGFSLLQGSKNEAKSAKIWQIFKNLYFYTCGRKTGCVVSSYVNQEAQAIY